MAVREQWVKVISDLERSGLSQRQFAEQRGVSLQGLRSWLYRVRRERSPEMRLLPVRMSAGPGRPPSVPAVGHRIEVTIGNAVLRIAEGTAVEYVVALVRALRDGC